MAYQSSVWNVPQTGVSVMSHRHADPPYTCSSPRYEMSALSLCCILINSEACFPGRSTRLCRFTPDITHIDVCYDSLWSDLASSLYAVKHISHTAVTERNEIAADDFCQIYKKAQIITSICHEQNCVIVFLRGTGRQRSWQYWLLFIAIVKFALFTSIQSCRPS